MSWIQTLEPDEAEDVLSALYRKVTDPRTGQLDNVMKIHSLHPAGLSAHFALYVAVMRGTSGLSAAEREMIATVVSKVNDCHY